MNRLLTPGGQSVGASASALSQQARPLAVMNLYNAVSSTMSIKGIMLYATFWGGFLDTVQFCGDSSGCCVCRWFTAF